MNEDDNEDAFSNRLFKRRKKTRGSPKKTFDNTRITLSTSINPSSVTNITVAQKRVNVPKNILEKYNSPQKSQVVLPQIPDFVVKQQRELVRDIEKSVDFGEIENLKDNKQVESFLRMKSIPLKNIIDDSSKKNLLEKMNSRERMKEKLFGINDVNFRTPYYQSSKFDKLKNNLDIPIKSNFINLIQYINSDQDINDRFINNLSKFSNEKLTKLNKISQVVIHNKSNECLFRDHVQKKIQMEKSNIGKDSGDIFNSASRDLIGLSEISNDYDFNQYNRNKKEQISQLHHDIKRDYWDKYKLDRLSRRNVRKNSTDSSYLQISERV